MRWGSAAILILAALGVVGASSPSAAAKQTPLSKVAYEERMQAISKSTTAAQARAAKHPSVSGVVLANEQAAIFAHEAAQLAAIAPPKDVSADHAFLVADDRRMAANCRALARFIAGKGPEPKLDTAASLRRSYLVLSDLRAKRYHLGGFTAG